MDDSSSNGRTRVLRAEDILPPYNKSKTDREQNPDAGIPKFNLAEQILAEQRKIASTKRKRSVDNDVQDSAVAGNRPLTTDNWLLKTPDPLQEQIIAEIVAKDIRRLCSSGRIGL